MTPLTRISLVTACPAVSPQWAARGASRVTVGREAQPVRDHRIGPSRRSPGTASGDARVRDMSVDEGGSFRLRNHMAEPVGIHRISRCKRGNRGRTAAFCLQSDKRFS